MISDTYSFNEISPTRYDVRRYKPRIYKLNGRWLVAREPERILGKISTVRRNQEAQRFVINLNYSEGLYNFISD